MLSDTELLAAAQAGDTNSCDEIYPRFKTRLIYLAHHACRLHGLHITEVDEVIQIAISALLTTETKFDAVRCDDVIPYLRGLVQNAARGHRRQVRRGAEQLHDYASPDNNRHNLPVNANDIEDRYDAAEQVETTDLAVAVMDMADEDEQQLIEQLYFEHKPVKIVAAALGVDRSTVCRRMSLFYQRVRESGLLNDVANSQLRN